MKRILFTLIACCGFYSLYAQSAEQKVTYSQEDSTVTTGELKRFYRYITRANVEEKTLLKVGFWPNSGGREFTARPTFQIGVLSDISVERKISPSFSVLAGLELSLQYNNYNRINVPYDRDGTGSLVDIDRTMYTSVYAKTGVRYYYAMAKRIRNGKSANNFSGNYLSLQAAYALSVRSTMRYYDTKTGQTIRTGTTALSMDYYKPSLAILWGMQRRLGRLGFLDVNGGPEFTVPAWSKTYLYPNKSVPFFKNSGQPSVSLRVNAVIGLGW